MKEVSLVLDPSLALPFQLYPAFAPLSVPIANHLILQEYRQSRRIVLANRPSAEQLWQTVQSRVSSARMVVYEYMQPFVIVDQKRNERGLPATYPSGEWLLDALATYTPEGKRIASPTLDYWQKKRLLRRARTRGPFDLMNVAALLIARIAEGEHQRNWLPSELAEDEPEWWCYGQASPGAPLQSLPIPLPPGLPAATLLWTPWLGASWLPDNWCILGNRAYRWAGCIETLQDIAIWDPDLAGTIEASRTNILTGQQKVQALLIQEASRLILQRMAGAL